MRTQLRFDVTASNAHRSGVSRDEVDIVLVEEAILQRNVEVVGQRIANASQRLPGETGVAVVDQVVGELGARNADTAADEALQAIVRTEVKQTVQHERESRNGTAELAVVQVDLGTLVAGFGFKAETTKVVTDDGVSVPTLVVVHIFQRGAGSGSARERIETGAESDVLIFNDGDAGFDTDIPAIITRQGRGGQGTGRKRSREGKLPHLDSPFKSVTKDC